MNGPTNALSISLSNFFITESKLTLTKTTYSTQFQLLNMSTPKIQLSAEEMILVNDTKWILTKHIIIKKVYEFFGNLLPLFQQELESFQYLFPENLRHQGGKISRGENYQLLPYVILDYPALFWKDNIFAIRTMFWWGHFFSITLQLSGTHKRKFISEKTGVKEWLERNNYFVCMSEGEWSHHFETDNYMASSDISNDQFNNILRKSFFKISKNISLTEWHNADTFLIDSFRELLQFLEFNFRADKKDLSPGSPTAGSGL